MLAKISVLVVCALITASPATAAEGSAADNPPPTPTTVARDRIGPAARLLTRPVDSVNWTDQTLEGVLAWLIDEGHGQVNVIAREKALRLEGVTLDSLISLKLKETTVADVLAEAIEQLSIELRYRAVGNKLTISTRADFEGSMQTRVYDLADIALPVPSFRQGVPQIDLQTSNAAGSVFTNAPAQEQSESGEQLTRDAELRLQRLRQIIQRHIEPASWQDSPTPQPAARGRIDTFDTLMIVTNTPEVLQQIAGLTGRH